MHSLIKQLKRFLDTYLLMELWRDLRVTGRYLFREKFPQVATLPLRVGIGSPTHPRKWRTGLKTPDCRS